MAATCIVLPWVVCVLLSTFCAPLSRSIHVLVVMHVLVDSMLGLAITPEVPNTSRSHFVFLSRRC